jgi:hypothetical protein
LLWQHRDSASVQPRARQRPSPSPSSSVGAIIGQASSVRAIIGRGHHRSSWQHHPRSGSADRAWADCSRRPGWPESSQLAAPYRSHGPSRSVRVPQQSAGRRRGGEGPAGALLPSRGQGPAGLHAEDHLRAGGCSTASTGRGPQCSEKKDGAGADGEDQPLTPLSLVSRPL